MSGPMDIRAQVVRSHRHYHADGNLVVRCENVLYRIWLGLFQMQSAVWNRIFSIPRHPDSLEGTTDNCPFVIPGTVTVKELDSLLDMMVGAGAELGDMEDEYTLPRYDIEDLIRVLKITTEWEMWHLRAIAITSIDSLPYHQGRAWDAFRKLACGVEYRVQDWIQVTFRMVASLPMDMWQGAHFRFLSNALMYKIACTKFEIDRHRKELASTAPPFVASVACDHELTDRERCKTAWEMSFFDVFARLLVHPDNRYNDLEVLDAMREYPSSDWGGLCEYCHSISVDNIADKGWFNKEGQIMDSAVATLL
ncbi:hypothetical protein EVJ58_g8222 [Rhodofomes roseus]|uniref:Uncharacterized protein n=1 Tax=Rhodofomes roseus TaxID=34475 RepID=A0A4Y9XZA2_9APHY|nr:hypothetical protein EVJ58_g8222 [Rhodofomes roseus]